MLKKIVSSSVALLFASQAFAANTNTIMSCIEDRRPVDGVLTQYELIRDDHNTYSLVHTTGFSGFPSGPTEPTAEVLHSSLACSASRGIALSCIYVEVPGFGPEIKVKVIKNADGKTYSIQQELTGHPMYKEPITEAKVLRNSIRCSFPNRI